MSILETTLIFVVIPVVAILVILPFSLIAVSNRPPAKQRFRIGDSWDRPPLLWSATDEVTSHGHHGHGGHAELEAGTAELIGGRASGKW